MIGLPSVPFTFHALTLEPYLADAIVATENGEALLMGEQPLIILLLDVRDGLEKFA